MMGDSNNDTPLFISATVEREFVQPSPVYGVDWKGTNRRGDPGLNPGETEGATRLHEHLGKKLDDASYLLGFAWSIIEGLTGGLPASDATLNQFRREYDAHFNHGRVGE